MHAHQNDISQLGKIGLLAAALVAASFASPRSIRAQDDASIAGTVRDASGAGIEAATIHISNLETGKHREL
jgi:hypothetical protein